jgi:hypothetical protein
MSGYAEHDVLKKNNFSAAIHIQKPFTVDMLLNRVAEALNGGGGRSTAATRLPA